jgi:hypothetical protein
MTAPKRPEPDTTANKKPENFRETFDFILVMVIASVALFLAVIALSAVSACK